ncbi:hypothetical protein RND81_03G228200 [Saponaria officinalis]|uniref:Transmembrane protein n=1 Tax=Saponaria officinalis TaxID=3572 RepID=A0AAW1M287_SAPOF
MTLKTLPVIQPTPPPPQQQPPPRSSILSWIFIDTRRRFILFLICSPVLLPLLCLSFPLICLARLYTCLRQRRRRSKRRRDDGLRRCEEGRGQEEEVEEREIGWLLMQRYLEDQLRLVGSVVAVYDCGHDDDDECDDDHDDYDGVNLDDRRRPLLV